VIDQNRPLGEQLRQAAAEVLDHRDRVLKAAELLPFWERRQVRETADKLMAFSTELREIAESLPTGEPGAPAEAEECPPELLVRIEYALQEYEIALEELGEIADELDAEAEEETPEPIH
jgi:hypothetical protein